MYDIFHFFSSGVGHSPRNLPRGTFPFGRRVGGEGLWALPSPEQRRHHGRPGVHVGLGRKWHHWTGHLGALGASHLCWCVLFHRRPLAPSEIATREQSGKAQQRFLRIHSVRTSYTEGNSPPGDDAALTVAPSTGPAAGREIHPPRLLLCSSRKWPEGQHGCASLMFSLTSKKPEHDLHFKFSSECLILGQDWPYL